MHTLVMLNNQCITSCLSQGTPKAGVPLTRRYMSGDAKTIIVSLSS